MADNIMKLGLVLSATDKMSRVIDQAVRKTGDRLKKFNANIESVNKVSNRMLATGGVMAAGIYKSVLAAEDGAASERKLENVFKTMWGNNGSANKAGKVASDYAEKLALQIGVEDDVIRTTQAKLATFAHVSNKVGMMSGVFDRATRASHDMAAVGFGEASQNAVMLGKALESPMTGIKALKKQGTLMDSDIVNIQNIFKTKGQLAAQKAILDAVERQVKGTGIATVKATDIMKVGFGKVTEAIGGAFLPSVEDAQKGIIGFLQSTIDWINKNHKLIQNIAKIAIGLVGMALAIRAVTATIKIIRGIMAAWNVVVGINAFFMKAMPLSMKSNVVALKAYQAMMKIASISQWLFNTSLYGCPIVWIIAGIMAVIAAVYLIVKNWSKISAFFKKLWGNIKDIFLKVWDWIKNMFLNYTPQGLIIKHWAGITGWFKSMITKFKNFGINIMKGLWEGIKSLVSKPIEAIKKVGEAIKDKFKSIFGIHSPSKVFAQFGVNMNQGLSKGLEDSKPKSIAATRNLATNTSNTFQSKSSINNGGITLTYAPVINIGTGSQSDKESFAKMLKDHKRELIQLLKEINGNNARISFA